ncbi:hypothetical protein FRC02_010898 [Tulasnella sp. 418]|nr:hypothetical protein FRC02_010898 [Tulasnella sp. 418]
MTTSLESSEIIDSQSTMVASCTSSSSGKSSSPPATPPSKHLRRYPSNLSRAEHRRPQPTKIDSQEPHTYQCLEDLLRVNGYRETRVFTPETDRIPKVTHTDANGAESGDSKGGRVTEVVASLLSSWIPGASVASNRLKGVVTDQASVEETTKPHAPTIRLQRSIDYDSLLDNQPISSSAPGARGAFKSLEDSLKQTGGTHLGFKRSASRPPTSFRHNTSKVITPSSSTIRPPSRQTSLQRSTRENGARLTAQNLESLAPPRPGQHLRHVNSAPSMGRAQRELRRTQSKLNAQALNARNQEGWLESFANMFTVSPRRPTPSRTPSLHRSRSRTSRRNLPPNAPFASYLHPSAPAASAILKTEPVLCRSAPSSRSASQVRNAAGRSGKASSKGAGSPASPNPLATPLLSPSVATKEDDPMSSMWTEAAVEHAVNVLQEYQSRSLLDQDTLDLSDPDPPDLRALLSTYAKGHRPTCSLDLDSTLDERIDDPVARRQRSIRSLQSSLRNHLAHTSTPGINGIPPLPDLPAIFKPSASASNEHLLEGPEWATSTSTKTKKRALIPWLASGDRRSSADDDSDSFEEPDAGRIRGRR